MLDNLHTRSWALAMRLKNLIYEGIEKKKLKQIISTSGYNFCTSRQKTKTKHRIAKPEWASTLHQKNVNHETNTNRLKI